MAAASQRITMQQLVIQAVEYYLNDRETVQVKTTLPGAKEKEFIPVPQTPEAHG